MRFTGLKMGIHTFEIIKIRQVRKSFFIEVEIKNENIKQIKSTKLLCCKL